MLTKVYHFWMNMKMKSAFIVNYAAAASRVRPGRPVQTEKWVELNMPMGRPGWSKSKSNSALSYKPKCNRIKDIYTVTEIQVEIGFAP